MSGKQERATELVMDVLRESDGMEPWLTNHFAMLQMDTPEEQAEFDRIGEAVASWASKVRALRALSNEVEQPVSTGPNKPGTVEALGRAQAEKYKAARVECGALGHDWPIKRPQEMAPGTSQTCARCGVTVTQHLRGRTYRWPEQGTEGQDRESYSDDQDRDEYTVNDEDTRGDR